LVGASDWQYDEPYDDDIAAVLQRLRDRVFAEGDYYYEGDDDEPVQEAPSGEGGPLDVIRARFADMVRLRDDPATDPRLRQKLAYELEQGAEVFSVFEAALARTAVRNDRSAPRTGRPTTIEELVEQQEDSGTHSILDCWSIDDSPDPELMTVAPMPPGAVSAVFGTTTPTTEAVRALDGELTGRFDDVLERWIGRYLVSHRDGRPDRIWFFGYSGD
jgi:hypothetical protein